MSGHRFSEFHCNRLPQEPDGIEPNAVMAIAIEKQSDGTAMEYIGSDGPRISGSTAEHIKIDPHSNLPAENVGPVIDGRSNSDVRAIGKKLVHDCRVALNMKP